MNLTANYEQPTVTFTFLSMRYLLAMINEPINGFLSSIYNIITHDTIWIALSTIVSGLVALATFRLATLTKTLASENARAIELSAAANAQADQHHQESFSPYVVTHADLTIVTTVRDELDAENKPTRRNQTQIFIFEGQILNIGAGPAISISLLIKPENLPIVVFTAIPMSAASEQEVRFTWDAKLNHVPKQSRELYPYMVTINYETVFDSHGLTYQVSHSGSRADIHQTEQSARPKTHSRKIPK